VFTLNKTHLLPRFCPVLLWALLLFAAVHGFARNDSYVVTHYTTDDGLPQNSIKTISFDKAGYCWLGTEMGLVRFDGTNFRIFGLDNIRGLCSDRVIAMAHDSTGNLYVELLGGQQLAITVPAAVPGPAPFPRLLPRQEVCFSIMNGYALRPPGMIEMLNHFIHAPEYGGVGNICIATPDSNNLYMVVEGSILHVDRTSLRPVTASTMGQEKSFIIADHTILFFRPGAKVSILKDGMLQPHTLAISGPLQGNKAFRSGNYRLIRSATGAFLYAGGILYRIYADHQSLASEILLTQSNAPGIDLSDIHTIYYNAGQRKYYIGTLTSGLYVLSTGVFRYPQVTDETMAGGFRSQAGVNGGEGIVCGQYLYYRDGSFKLLPLDRYIGATVHISADNIVYYGNEPELNRFDLKTQRKTMLLNLDSRPSTIVPDTPGSRHIWIATSLSVGRLYDDTSSILRKVPGIKDGAHIWGLVRVGEDSLLLATQRGLKWYDWSRNRIFRSVLDSFSIYSLYAEPAGRIWISTYGKGIFLYDKGKITPLPSGTIHALKMVHSFVDDGRGYFWLPTNNGLYRVSKNALLAYAAGKLKDIYYYAFSVSDGLRSNEFNGASIPHYVWFKDSMLSLLSIKGPVWFYPGKVSVNYPDKAIYADQLEVDNKAMPYPGDGHIQLPPDFNNLTLTVSSPYFGSKENLQLKYKVEGAGADWQSVDRSGKIKLNRMPSGDYRLIVRKLNGRDTDPYDSFILSFTVSPRFYNTWWFYALLAAVTAGSVYTGIKLRMRMLVRRNQKLEDIIAVQTEDLNKTIRKLSASRQELSESNRMKDNLITMVLHDLRSPIRFLHLISKKTATGYRQMEAGELGRRIVEINTSVAAINDFTEQFFTWAASHRQNFVVRKTWVDVQLLFGEIADLYEDIIKLNNNKLQVSPGDFYCYTDKNILSVIIRNLLDNANKNTQHGTVSLFAACTETHLKITVADTGSGLREPKLQAFGSTPGEGGHSSGYGSMLVMVLLEKIGGTLQISTEPGIGSVFEITLDRK